MLTTQKAKTLLTFAAVGICAFACLSSSGKAALVAHFPLTEGVNGATANTIDDIVDDPTHGVTDGTANNDDATWVFDATRNRIVLSTVQGNRFTAGTQDLDLSEGFTWSLWVKSDSAGNADGGADVIIGSRNGTWNKVQPTGTERWFSLGGYNVDDDTWHHLAYAGDTSGAAFYVDGAEVSTDATPFNSLQAIDDVMEIGGSSRFSEDWTGLLSDIGIWNERLSETRIQELAAGGAVPEPSTFGLAALGLLGLIGVTRRRKR